MSNSIKFTIEVMCKEHISTDRISIQNRLLECIRDISHMIDRWEIKAEACEIDHLSEIECDYFNKEFHDLINEELNEFENKIEELKCNFYNEKIFENYINNLPKYWNRNESKSVKYIKDYLTKNRSARLREIVDGCKEQGFKARSCNDPMSSIYLRLKALVDKGKITKDGKVYIWNYDEDM